MITAPASCGSRFGTRAPFFTFIHWSVSDFGQITSVTRFGREPTLLPYVIDIKHLAITLLRKLSA
jgi:hypothetical protein